MSGNFMSGKKVVWALADRGLVTPTTLQPPISVEIQPTNRCNYDCEFCSYAVRRKNSEQLSAMALAHLCDDLISLRVKTVYFAGGGEPTTFRGLSNYVSRLRRAGIEVALITNGSNLISLEQCGPYCTYFLINVASSDVDVFSTLMGHRMPSHLEHLGNRLKRELGKDCPVIGARMVLVDKNMGTLSKTVSSLKSWGFDYVVCTPAADYENRAIAYAPDLDHPELKKLRGDPPMNDFVVWGPKTSHYDPVEQCWAISQRMHALVDARGDIYLCTPDVGASQLSIGNINETSFAQVWNGPAHKQRVQELQKRYVAGECRNCRFIKANGYLEEAVRSSEIPHRYFV